jgi:hypothetical protein
MPITASILQRGESKSKTLVFRDRLLRYLIGYLHAHYIDLLKTRSTCANLK